MALTVVAFFALRFEKCNAVSTQNLTALRTEIAPPWFTGPSTRGTTSLIYTCVFTISLCVYTALHLNISPQGTTPFQNFLHKAKWVVIGIFAPEAVVYAAFVQLRTVWKFRNAMNEVLSENSKSLPDVAAAGNSTQGPTVIQTPPAEVSNPPPSLDDRERASTPAQKLSAAEGEGIPAIPVNPTDRASTTEIPNSAETPIPGGMSKPSLDLDAFRVTNSQATSKEEAFPDRTVTLAYTWYVVMGGFRLDLSPLHDYYDVMTITHHGVLYLAKRGLFLSVAEESITDKSKADFLAKGLVFIQVFFLVVQCVARKIEGLPISLLEIHTLVHVVCAASMYLAWWGKPLDISDPTRVDGMVWGNPSREEALKWQSVIANMLMKSTLLKSWRLPESLRHPPEGEIDLAGKFYDIPGMHYSEARVVGSKVVIGSPGVIHDGFHLDVTVISKDGLNPPVALPLLTGQTIFPILTVIGFEHYHSLGLLKLHFTERAIRRWILALSSPENYVEQPRPRSPYFETTIPNLFSPSYENDFWSILIAWSTCFAYGGIHATAWNFIFPSEKERLLWRISCPLLITLGVPVTSFVRFILLLATKGWVETAAKLLGCLKRDYDLTQSIPLTQFLLNIFVIFSLPFYLAARVFLVMEAFISLRHVPLGVYSTIDWSLNIPHL